MTYIQEEAIDLIQRLPDEKIQAIISLAKEQLALMEMNGEDFVPKKIRAFKQLESINISLPDGFDADKELAEAMESKYGHIA